MNYKNMDYQTFKTAAVSSLQQQLGEAAAVSLHSVTRNNNVQFDGLTIQDPSVNISPTIYLNPYYDEYIHGRAFDSVTEDILAAYRGSRMEKSIDLSFFTDYEKAKQRIIYKVINYKRNEALLQDLPHFRFLDLAVVFCCLLTDSSQGSATILIHKHHLDCWHITQDELYEQSVANTPLLLPDVLSPMTDVLKTLSAEIMPDRPYTGNGQLPPDDGLPLYVLTNSSRLFGASCMLYPGVLADFAAKLHADLYILPSSVHEVLLLPKLKDISLKELNAMVREVNATQVQEDELLSDHIYLFERSRGYLTLPCKDSGTASGTPSLSFSTKNHTSFPGTSDPSMPACYYNTDPLPPVSGPSSPEHCN